MNKGKLIVLDGLDGSGKATQTDLLTKKLIQKGLQVKHISFPDYNNPSSSLVKMYLNGSFGGNPNDVNAYAASSFYAVDRYASYKQFWQQDYANGTIIIADRYSTSNAIYQLSKVDTYEKSKFLQWLEYFEYGLLQLPKPDAVIFLDMPIEISQKLLTERYKGDNSKKDLHESNFEFLQQCRQSALFSAKEQSWSIISCAENGQPRSIEDIHHDVVSLAEKIVCI